MYDNLKDAVIDALQQLGGIAHRKEIYNKIIENRLYSFGQGKTPIDSISTVLQNNSQSSDYGTENIFYCVHGIKARK